MTAVLIVRVTEDREEKTRSIAIEITFQVLILSVAETSTHAGSQTSRTDDGKKLRGHHIEKKAYRMRAKRPNGGIRTRREEEVEERRVNIEPAAEMVREIGV